MTEHVSVGPSKALLLVVTRWPDIFSPENTRLGRCLEERVLWLSRTLSSYCGYEHIEVHLSPLVSRMSVENIIKSLPEGTSVSRNKLDKSTIKYELKQFSKTCQSENPKQVFVFLCSHGFLGKSEEPSPYFFCPEDGKMTQDNRPDSNTMISVSDIRDFLQSVKLQQKSEGTKCLVMIDTCYSGQIPGIVGQTGTLMLGRDESLLDERTRTRIREEIEVDMSHGTALCFSAGPYEESRDLTFLDALIDGLQGAAKLSSYNPERLVGFPSPRYKSMESLSFQELWDYIENRVQRKAQLGGYAQKPSMIRIPTSDDIVDFTVAMLPQSLHIDMDTDEDRPRRNIGKFFGLGSDLQEEVQTQLKRCKESVQLLEGENKQKMLDMLKDFERALHIPDASPTFVAFSGKIKAGKSTLVNALAENEVLPALTEGACTSTVITVRNNSSSVSDKAFFAKAALKTVSEWEETMDQCGASSSDVEEPVGMSFGLEDFNPSESLQHRCKAINSTKHEYISETALNRKTVSEETDDKVRFQAFIKQWSSTAKLRGSPDTVRNMYPVVDRMDVFLKGCDILKNGIILIDLPGEDDSSPLTHRLSQAVIHKADVLCVVSPINEIGSSKTVTCLIESAGRNSKVILIPTKIDDVNPPEYAAQEELAMNPQVQQLQESALAEGSKPAAREQFKQYVVGERIKRLNETLKSGRCRGKFAEIFPVSSRHYLLDRRDDKNSEKKCEKYQGWGILPAGLAGVDQLREYLTAVHSSREKDYYTKQLVALEIKAVCLYESCEVTPANKKYKSAVTTAAINLRIHVNALFENKRCRAVEALNKTKAQLTSDLHDMKSSFPWIDVLSKFFKTSIGRDRGLPTFRRYIWTSLCSKGYSRIRELLSDTVEEICVSDKSSLETEVTYFLEEVGAAASCISDSKKNRNLKYSTYTTWCLKQFVLLSDEVAFLAHLDCEQWSLFANKLVLKNIYTDALELFSHDKPIGQVAPLPKAGLLEELWTNFMDFCTRDLKKISVDLVEVFRDQSLRHLFEVVVKPFERLSLQVIRKDVAESISLLVDSVQKLIDEANMILDEGASPESVAKKPKI